MKVAIITDDAQCIHTLENLLKDWDIRFFKSPKEFGKTRLKQYQVVIADQSLIPTDGRRILKAISYKTNAELFLMTNGTFISEDAKDGNINGLINKSDPGNILDSLKYVSSKLQVKRLAWQEKTKYRKMVSNGFNIQIKGRIALIELNEVLSEESKKDMGRELNALEVNGAVISFPKTDRLTSSYMRMVVYILKIFEPKNERIAIWNRNHIKKIEDQMEVSRFNSVVPIYERLEDAVDYLEETLLVSKNSG